MSKCKLTVIARRPPSGLKQMCRKRTESKRMCGKPRTYCILWGVIYVIFGHCIYYDIPLFIVGVFGWFGVHGGRVIGTCQCGDCQAAPIGSRTGWPDTHDIIRYFGDVVLENLYGVENRYVF